MKFKICLTGVSGWGGRQNASEAEFKRIKGKIFPIDERHQYIILRNHKNLKQINKKKSKTRHTLMKLQKTKDKTFKVAIEAVTLSPL